MYSRKQKHLSTRYALHYSLLLSIVPMYIQPAAVYVYSKHPWGLPRCFFGYLSRNPEYAQMMEYDHTSYTNAMRKGYHTSSSCLTSLLSPHSSIPSVTPLRTTAPLTLKLKPLKLIQTRHITLGIDVFVMIEIGDNTLSITSPFHIVLLPLLRYV